MNNKVNPFSVFFSAHSINTQATGAEDEGDGIESFEEVDDDEADVFLKKQMGVLEKNGDEDIADLEDNGDSFEVRMWTFQIRKMRHKSNNRLIIGRIQLR